MVKNKLQQYFPIIHTRDEILTKIHESEHLNTLFDQWTEEQQNEFLDFTTGVRGVKILYDSFYKEIMNPETTPERLGDFLSLLLKREVKVIDVLPNDNNRIANESSLLIMDIVVRLDDGSLANIEIQKIGYAFPGQRCACYSADLLLRQYKRVRGKTKGKKFNYKDLKAVYTIVLFERSSAIFHKYPNDYIHNFEQHSDTGLAIDLLQKYIFVPLDIFKENLQNRDIETRLDAWLAFFSLDDPDVILSIINKFPDFKDLYAHVYDMCLNIERVMEMFSKELQELDRNTVQYMIDEMQEQIDRQNAQLEAMQQSQAELLDKKRHIEEVLTEKERQYQAALRRIAELEKNS